MSNVKSHLKEMIQHKLKLEQLNLQTQNIQPIHQSFLNNFKLLLNIKATMRWIGLIIQQKIRMPPKKEKQQEAQSKDPKQKQTKLFSKDVVDQPVKPAKTKSKQFNSNNELVAESKTSVHKWTYGNGKTPDRLTISSWNVNGVRSVLKKNELQSYIEKHKPDIFCLNQTKIDQSKIETQKIEFPGYHSYWNCCKCSSGYSGVAIFSKFLPISLVQDLPQKEHSQEGRVLTMQFEKFYLVTAYIPNAGSKLQRLEYRVNEYDRSFQKHCEQLRKKKATIICGDLNVCHKEIDIARPKGNEKTAGFTAEERNSFTQFLKNGWVDTFRELHPTQVKYSWWSMRTKGREKNIGWRLDYFIVNEELMPHVKESSINNEIFGSDHCPIELVLDLPK